MAQNFLGIPLLVWSGVALMMAILFVFIWPRRLVDGAMPPGHLLILRWGHAAVWLLLAASLFLRATGALGGAATANIIALLALAAYLSFIATLLRGSGRKNDE